MSNLLLPISSLEDYHHLVPFCESLAKRMNYTLIVCTFEDRGMKLKNQLYLSDKRVTGSEKSFYKILEDMVSSTDFDISLVCIYPGSVVLDVNHNCLRFFSRMRSLPIPYLLLPDLVKKDWSPKNIYFPLCTRDGEKEASAWAGFWTRYTGGQLHLIHLEIKDNEKQRGMLAILNFTRRLLNKSGVTYETKSYGIRKRDTVNYSLEMAKRSDLGLLILPAHKLNSPEYIFTGPPEKRILKNRGNTPVLFVNPRRDLYLPCG